MTHLRSSAESRTLTVVLSESEWRALREVEPDAVGWLQAQIRERLSASGAQETQGGAAAASAHANSWGDDLY